jgi:hypothetical protein
MRCPWVKPLVVVWAVAGTTQGRAQQVREVGIQGVATASDPAAGVAGAYAAIRTSGRTRLSGYIGGGASGGKFAWRTEALGYFLLSPDRRRGWGPYLAGGLAAAGGSVDRGYIVLTLGAEERPRSSSGWVAELGIGGGVRLGLGYRWRRFPGTWAK